MVAPSQLHPGDSLERLPCCDLVGVDLHQLLPLGANLPSATNEAHGPEQIPLDRQQVEAPDAVLRVDPVQDHMAVSIVF